MSHDQLHRHSTDSAWCPSSPGRRKAFIPFPAGSIPWVCRVMGLPQEGSQGCEAIPLGPHRGSCAAPLAESCGTSGASPHLVGMEGSDAINAKWRACSKKADSLYSGLGDSCLRGREVKRMRAAESFSIFNTARSRQFFGPELLSFLPGHRFPGYAHTPRVYSCPQQHTGVNPPFLDSHFTLRSSCLTPHPSEV